MSFNEQQREKKQRPIAPMGTHAALCYSIIDLGTHMKAYQGQEPVRTPLVHFSWEFPFLPEQVFDTEKGPQRLAIFSDYTISLNEKAKLKKILCSWRGIATIQNLAVELPQYLGQRCMITVTHAQDKTHKHITYANIANNGASVVRYAEGMADPGKPKNELIYFELSTEKQINWTIFKKIPKFLQDKIRASFEWPVIIQKWGPEPVDQNAQNSYSQNNQSVNYMQTNAQVVQQNQQQQFQGQQQNNGFNNPGAEMPSMETPDIISGNKNNSSAPPF